MARMLGACFALGEILLVLASISMVSEGTRVIVGDSRHWQFGFNYSDWALNTAPFYQNDNLVFMYEPPSNTTHAHSVYLLKDLRSFLACDFKKAKLVVMATQGGGNGLEFALKKRKTHYFTCGESAGFHCRVGLMKFSVLPVTRPCTCHT